MQYIDHRLSKILSDIRIEQAQRHNQRRQLRHGSPRIKERLGHWLIDQGESLAEGKAKAA